MPEFDYAYTPEWNIAGPRVINNNGIETSAGIVDVHVDQSTLQRYMLNKIDLTVSENDSMALYERRMFLSHMLIDFGSSSLTDSLIHAVSVDSDQDLGGVCAKFVGGLTEFFSFGALGGAFFPGMEIVTKDVDINPLVHINTKRIVALKGRKNPHTIKSEVTKVFAEEVGHALDWLNPEQHKAFVSSQKNMWKVAALAGAGYVGAQLIAKALSSHQLNSEETLLFASALCYGSASTFFLTQFAYRRFNYAERLAREFVKNEAAKIGSMIDVTVY